MKKYLGLDWGEKRIGLALADEETKLALPFKTVDNLSAVLEIIKKEKIDEIILGQPIKLSGKPDQLDCNFSRFLKVLKKKTKLAIILIDERFSTQAGQALAGSKKDKADQDALAACLILQNYLDSLEN